jgi:hypothetical protein
MKPSDFVEVEGIRAGPPEKEFIHHDEVPWGDIPKCSWEELSAMTPEQRRKREELFAARFEALWDAGRLTAFKRIPAKFPVYQRIEPPVTRKWGAT